jgi:hypothetical protein
MSELVLIRQKQAHATLDPTPCGVDSPGPAPVRRATVAFPLPNGSATLPTPEPDAPPVAPGVNLAAGQSHLPPNLGF